jgi:hypothetical protein
MNDNFGTERDLDHRAVMFAHGLLTAHLTRTADPEQLLAAEFLDHPAEDRGRFLADVALAAVLALSGVLDGMHRAGLVDVESSLAAIALELEGLAR